MKWTDLLIWACIVSNAEACFEDGEFYCAKLWYFWFVVFFIFVFILIGAIITTNLCTKKKRRVGTRGGNGRKSKRKPQTDRRKESKSSILSKTPSESTNSDALPPKLPVPSHTGEGDLVASKRYFSQKGTPKKGTTSNRVTISRDVSVAENGEAPPTGDDILTARDLPTSLVMEVEETNYGKDSNSGDNNVHTDTAC